VNGDRAAGPIGRFLAARVEEGWMPGAVWWVEGPHGPIDRGAVGWASVEPERRLLDEHTPFDLASLTKPLCTALLLTLLEREARLDPGQPVSRWLEAMRESAFSQTSLLDLATHRGGLPAWRPLYLNASDRRGYLEQIARELPAVPAGETLYSDLGYILLGMVIEEATGQSLDGLFRDRVVSACGDPRIGFAAGDYGDAASTERGNAYERRMADVDGSVHPWRHSILRGQVHDANAWSLGGVAGHAGLFGTAEAVADIARELLRATKLPLGYQERESLLRPRHGAGGRTVGMVVASHSGAARGILPSSAPGHTGFTGTSLWVDPPSGRLFVLLTNRVHPEVDRRDFQRIRRGFHRLAIRVSGGTERALTLE
jgi:CubicO group peptidase (beta-lactamase class C family)